MSEYLKYDWSVVELERLPGETVIKNIYCFSYAGDRETMSGNWFFHGVKEWDCNKTVFYRKYHNWSFERIKKYITSREIKDYLPRLIAGNFIPCANLYDFYEKIGWDRKAQLLF